MLPDDGAAEALGRGLGGHEGGGVELEAVVVADDEDVPGGANATTTRTAVVPGPGAAALAGPIHGPHPLTPHDPPLGPGAAALAGPIDAGDAAAARRGAELRGRLLDALQALPAMAEEAAQAGGCWRHPFPAAAVVAVCAALRGMLEALGLMHTTLTALQPGEATSLIEPLLQPLNRVEAQVAHSLQAILQRLRAGSATHGAMLFDLRHMQQPLALMPSTLRLFEDCYAECLRGIVAANRRALSSMATNAPSLSNNEVLTFNALVYSIKALIHHMGSCYERLEEMLAVQRPINLRSIKFV